MHWVRISVFVFVPLSQAAWALAPCRCSIACAASVPSKMCRQNARCEKICNCKMSAHSMMDSSKTRSIFDERKKLSC